MIQISPTALYGCLEIIPQLKPDFRGTFFKTFHSEYFAEHHLETVFLEEYFSWSLPGVIRGMHFQTPPCQHTKIVSCLVGSVTDVVVDLRLGSPTYKQSVKITLNSRKANMLYIPEGFAHGFAVPEAEALMHYKVSSVYAPVNDVGIRWDTLGIDWNILSPIVSERDRSFEDLENFKSPFVFVE